MPKLLRTIRLDPSDAFVFTRAAEPGEWAVPGTFLFWERPVETLIGKERRPSGPVCSAFPALVGPLWPRLSRPMRPSGSI